MEYFTKFYNFAFVNLCQVCVKYQHGSTMSEVMEILTSILKVIENPKNRLSMLNRISDTFKEFILDTHEYTDSGKIV